jgi:siroheme synthase
LAQAVNTIVVLMGIERLDSITYNLIKAGLSKDTEIAIIENGTTMEQRVIKGTLHNIVERVKGAKVKPPAIIIIGKVVSLQEKLNWFNK